MDKTPVFSKKYGKNNRYIKKDIQLSILKQKPKKHITDYFGIASSNFSFCNIPTRKRQYEIQDNNNNNTQNIKTKKQYTEMEQLHLDLNVKNQGGILVCSECNMRYNMFVSQDNLLHKRFHNYFTNGFRIKGWKTQDVVPYFHLRKEQEKIKRKILCVSKKTENSLFKKILELLSVVNTELGSAALTPDELGKTKIFVYLKDNETCGLISVEPVFLSNCMFNDESLFLNENRMTIGISKIWVSKKHRREGIATDLVESSRLFFFPEIKIEKKQVAFSHMTQEGLLFAKSYFKSNHFLVYKN